MDVIVNRINQLTIMYNITTMLLLKVTNMLVNISWIDLSSVTVIIFKTPYFPFNFGLQINKKIKSND